MAEFYRIGTDSASRMCEYGGRLMQLIMDLGNLGDTKYSTVLDYDDREEVKVYYDPIWLKHMAGVGLAAVALEATGRRYGKLATTITASSESRTGVDGGLWFEDVDGRQYEGMVSAFRTHNEITIRHATFHKLANTMMKIMTLEQQRADFDARFTER